MSLNDYKKKRLEDLYSLTDPFYLQEEERKHYISVLSLSDDTPYADAYNVFKENIGYELTKHLNYWGAR